jgi:mannose-6-phosphate isomerase-like protein (cupin superfamily)
MAAPLSQTLQLEADDAFAKAPAPDELRTALLANRNYRWVLYTHRNDAEDTLVYKGDFQMVAMSLGMNPDDVTVVDAKAGKTQPNLEFGLEQHDFNLQYFAVAYVEGTAKASMRQPGDAAATEFVLRADSKWSVPPGTQHNVYIAQGAKLQVLTIYTPPHHPRGTVDATRAAAERRELNSLKCFVCGAVATLECERRTGTYACTKQHEALCSVRQYTH